MKIGHELNSCVFISRECIIYIPTHSYTVNKKHQAHNRMGSGKTFKIYVHGDIERILTSTYFYTEKLSNGLCKCTLNKLKIITAAK